MAQATRTIDHVEIKEWVEERGGIPSVVEGTRDGESGILRIDFGEIDEPLEEISWEEFFRIFDQNDLAFMYSQEDGGDSYVCKFVARNDNDADTFEIDEGPAYGSEGL